MLHMSLTKEIKKMITKSEQCLTCEYLHNCDLYFSQDKILDEVKRNSSWPELTNRYFKNGTISNNKIIDNLILGLSTADNIHDFRKNFLLLLCNDLSSPKNCVCYKSNNCKNDDDNGNNNSINTIKW